MAKQSTGSRATISMTHPTLAKEFIKCLCDRKGCLKHNPENTTHGSHRVFQWLCKNDHLYSAKVGSRASGVRTTGCALCSNASIPYSKETFKVANPTLYKMAVKCLTCKDCSKESITQGSSCLWQFKCPKQHLFTSTIYNASRSKTDCRACIVGLLSESNLSKEFVKCLCGTCEQGITKHTVKSITQGSGKKSEWKCKKCKSHFTARVVDRFDKEYPASCRVCAPTSFSNRELELMHVVAFKLKRNYTGPVKVDGWSYPVDFADTSRKIVIQYDSAYWHKDRHLADKRCVTTLKASGWKVIRVRETPLKNVGGRTVKTTSKESVDTLSDKIIKMVNLITKE